MTPLERYEWCDFWWEEATSQDKPRVLLIGDSITRAYRPHVNKLLQGIAYTDMLATSKAVDNPCILRELDYIISHRGDFTYKIIHVNNGLHGFHLTAADYERHYDQMIAHLLEHSQSAKIIIVLTTPKTISGDPTQLDPEINDKVKERNRATERLAAKYNLAIDDLYTPMLGASEYRVADGYHYNAAGEQAQAEIVAGVIKRWLL